MANECMIELMTPAEGPQEIKVRPLGEGIFLSLAAADPFSRYRILCGDKFEAKELAPGSYQLIKIVQPFEVSHFEASLGMFLLNPECQTREQKDQAFRGLGNLLTDGYGTPALDEFMRDCSGGWEWFEFVQHYTLFMHVPNAYKEQFLAALPRLCPSLKNGELRGIFSGLNAEAGDW